MKKEQKTKNKEESTQTEQYDRFNFLSPFSVSYWLEKFKENTAKKFSFMAIFLLRNGKFDIQIIHSKTDSFYYLNREYVIDMDSSGEHIQTGYRTLFYYQDCSIPMKISVNMTELKSRLTNSNIDVIKAINPTNLRSFIDSQIIEKILKAEELTDALALVKILVIISTVVSSGSLLILLKMSGVF